MQKRSLRKGSVRSSTYGYSAAGDWSSLQSIPTTEAVGARRRSFLVVPLAVVDCGPGTGVSAYAAGGRRLRTR